MVEAGLNGFHAGLYFVHKALLAEAYAAKFPYHVVATLEDHLPSPLRQSLDPLVL